MEAAANLEAAAEASRRLEFFQRLLAAEASSSKRQAILSDLGASLDAQALLEHPLLTVGERKRAKDANMNLAERAIANGIGLLTGDDLPAQLAKAPGSADALFVWGDVSALSCPTIAIVGTRQASTYGKAVAQKFAEAFARAGVTVVSGGAYGIDAAAHKGAIAAQGRTAAVLLTGIEKTYPNEHRGLFQQIRERGCLVSEFAVGAGIGQHHPLIRNYTIAAFSLGVLLVEVPARSGAIATAHAANDLGRQVFAVPANIDSESFRGSHSLIRDGATLVDHPDQVLSALSIQPQLQPTLSIEMSPLAQKILSVLSVNPLSADLIIERTGIPSAEILSELTMMELDGLVIRDRLGYAVRV